MFILLFSVFVYHKFYMPDYGRNQNYSEHGNYVKFFYSYENMNVVNQVD